MNSLSRVHSPSKRASIQTMSRGAVLLYDTVSEKVGHIMCMMGGTSGTRNQHHGKNPAPGSYEPHAAATRDRERFGTARGRIVYRPRRGESTRRAGPGTPPCEQFDKNRMIKVTHYDALSTMAFSLSLCTTMSLVRSVHLPRIRRHGQRSFYYARRGRAVRVRVGRYTRPAPLTLF